MTQLPDDMSEDENADKAIAPLLSVALRTKFFLTGALFPLICLASAIFFGGPMTADEPWQSGRWEHYTTMLLRWPAIGPFLPGILYSIVSLSWLVFRPAAVRLFPLRWGIYSGAPLAGLFLIFIVLTSGPVTFVAAAFVGAALFGLGYAAEWLFARRRRFKIRDLLVFTAVCAVFAALLRLAEVRAITAALFGIPFFFILAATPTLNVITYARLSVWAGKRQAGQGGASRWSIAGWIAWATATAATLKLAVDLMLDEYSRLPTSDPNCYVSTAAAMGHAWLEGGKSRVSLQTRRLKFFEFVVRAVVPTVHAKLRRRYDHCGPRLAQACRRNRWFADFTYLMLKPVEWCAEGSRIALRVPARRVKSLYRRKKTRIARRQFPA